MFLLHSWTHFEIVRHQVKEKGTSNREGEGRAKGDEEGKGGK